ncbi:hypothetical protein [Streptomyces sp. NPDC057072]|uniref:hypothetical protein n=1 Tax=Streptomyces sp. NPDC057072 TaxID=3346014 RepID=UPI00363AFAC4
MGEHLITPISERHREVGSTWGWDDDGLAGSIGKELTDDWPLLRSGAFKGSLGHAQMVHAKLVDWKNKHAQRS